MTDSLSFGDSDRGERVLQRAAEMHDYLRERAFEAEAPGDGAPRPFAKYPGRNFSYDEELDALEDVMEPDPERVLPEVAAFFRGAQRHESPSCLFNLNVVPTVDATAAACTSVIANVNGLMDAFGGEALLVEQKVARCIGRWAGWPQAMGISCGGGKATMLHALRCAIARFDPAARQHGITERLVVFCSAGAHYSVEHAAAIVGLGSASVRRIPLDERGCMRRVDLESAFEQAHAAGETVAAIACCGGTVIDFCCDHLDEVHDVAATHAARTGVEVPYLHFDAVIGWLYLTMRNLDGVVLDDVLGRGAVRARVSEMLSRLGALEHFDSLGVDLHKTGLCPYTSSFFVSRDRGFMDALGEGTHAWDDTDMHFGRFRSYRYTLENTRSTHGTLAAWINLVALGRTGLSRYLSELHKGRAGVEAALARHGRFKPLNTSSLGWEVVFDIPQPAAVAGVAYRDFAVAFIEYTWKRVLGGAGSPLFSIVPEFQVDHQPDRARVAFVIYPMGPRDAGDWDWVVEAISAELDRFVSEGHFLHSEPWERPIR